MFNLKLTNKAFLSLLVLLALPGILCLSLMQSGQAVQAQSVLVSHNHNPIQQMPLRAHCNALLQHPINGTEQPCFPKLLMNWQGSEMYISPTVKTPLRWTLYARCLKGQGVVTVNGYDAQMPLFSEVWPCDGLWHSNVYYPLNDTIFFGVSRPVTIQVWTAV